MSKRILQRPIVKIKNEVSTSLLGFLLCEMVQYTLQNSGGSDSLSGEEKLHEMGLRVGYRLLDYLSLRESILSSKNVLKRETRYLNALSNIASTYWKFLFGYTIDLLRNQRETNEYWLNDTQMLFTKYIHCFSDSHTNVCTWVAGMIEGLLLASDISSQVFAVAQDNVTGSNVTFVIILEDHVVRGE